MIMFCLEDMGKGPPFGYATVNAPLSRIFSLHNQMCHCTMETGQVLALALFVIEPSNNK